MPNARLETWPVPGAGPLDLRQHMMVVATEPIEAGAEGGAPPACTPSPALMRDLASNQQCLAVL